jgi:hypothetical protein
MNVNKRFKITDATSNFIGNDSCQGELNWHGLQFNPVSSLAPWGKSCKEFVKFYSTNPLSLLYLYPVSTGVD